MKTVVDILSSEPCSCSDIDGSCLGCRIAEAIARERRAAAEAADEAEFHGRPEEQWRPINETTAFAAPFGRVRACRECGCLVAGGPTACGRCAEDPVRTPTMQANVAAFQAQVVGEPFPAGPPRVPSDEALRVRLRLVVEEFCELIDACGVDSAGVMHESTQATATWGAFAAPNLPEVADAIADLVYVLEGTALACGIDMVPIHAAVHAANMAKLGGPVVDGKLRKPAGWRPPDIVGELVLQGWTPPAGSPIADQLRVLVCGDRRWTNREAIRGELAKCPPGTVVIHGCAAGADSIAGDVAKELGFTVEEYPARWDLHGKAAGPVRNRQMLFQGKPDRVLAFHPNIRESKGTKNMVSAAGAAGVEVEIFKE